MIWIRIITLAFALLYGIYYLMVVGQMFDAFKFTNRKFTFMRSIIPFYYWIAPQNEKKTKKK